MEFRQLRYFIAVAEERHLGHAAARLHLSQPPLSRQIQALEDELGAQLFVRTGRGMELTQAGRALLDKARNIRDLVDKASEHTRRAGQGQAGKLDVGVYGSVIFDVVPSVLSLFRQRHPDVEVALHHGQTPEQVTALRQGRVLIVFERLLPQEDDIAVELVVREPLWVALNALHPLAGRDAVAVDDLRDQLIVVGSSLQHAMTVVELCRHHGFEPRLSEPMSNTVLATLLAGSGPGVSLVPASMLNVRFPGVVYRPLRAEVKATMDLYCLHLRGERSPLLTRMLEVVRAFRASCEGTAAPDAAAGFASPFNG